MTSHSTPAGRSRTAVTGAAAGLVLLAGLYLVLAPWVAGSEGRACSRSATPLSA
ncbi:SPW repeat protein [Amycolatopsis sp. NPDC048633]|uniref:SPW repeat domain-containing protein n=1 Tax=Amycolatopsis sp. NPDC048633 TaxID=3157095 RepID=UPI0033E61FBB